MNNPTHWNGGDPEQVKYLTEAELRRFFSAVRANPKARIRRRDLCLMSMILHFGLRQEEAISMRLDQLELDRGQIFIRRVKGGQSRHYDLPAELIKLIKSWLREREKFPHAELNPLLFITQTRSHERGLSSPQFFTLFKRYANQAGVPWAHPHTLRHTAGVLMAKQGKSAFQIRDRLGHSSVLSSQVYVELGSPDRAKQDADINRIFAGY